jgi:hypothetical protein
MRQHHQSGSVGELLLESRQDLAVGLGLFIAPLPQLLHGQGVDLQLVATRQLMAGSHDSGVLTVADQYVVAVLPGKAPERQHTSGGDVLAESESMRRYMAETGQAAACVVHLGTDVGPDVCGERAELLDAFPAGVDGLQ